MIKHLRHNEIDKARWDECLIQARNDRVYACSWYLDIVSPHWEALVLENYEAIMPLPIRSKWGIQYLYIPPFTQQLGLFSIQNNEDTLLKAFLNAIPKTIRYYDLFLNSANTIGFPPHALIENRTTQVLPLNRPYEALYKGYSDNLKRNLKKAAGFSINENISPKTVTSMFATEKADVTDSLEGGSLKILENIISRVVSTKTGYCAGVLHTNGELLASACFAKFCKRIYYLKGSATAEGKQHGAMHLLLNSVIQQYAGSDMVFDFSGSVMPGLVRFYKSYEAEDEYYPYIKEYRFPTMFNQMIKLIK